jgi:hypothetical protein
MHGGQGNDIEPARTTALLYAAETLDPRRLNKESQEQRTVTRSMGNPEEDGHITDRNHGDPEHESQQK